MHDLNTINRLNAEAHADAINRLRRDGIHVVADYEGLTLVSHVGFPNIKQAIDYAEQADKLQGQSRRVLPATTQPPGKGCGNCRHWFTPTGAHPCNVCLPLNHMPNWEQR